MIDPVILYCYYYVLAVVESKIVMENDIANPSSKGLCYKGG